MGRAQAAAWVALVLFAVVAMREWTYRSSHMHHSGPAGELVALGIAGAALAGVLVWVMRWLIDHERTEVQRSQRDWQNEWQQQHAPGSDEEADRFLELYLGHYEKSPPTPEG